MPAHNPRVARRTGTGPELFVVSQRDKRETPGKRGRADLGKTLMGWGSDFDTEARARPPSIVIHRTVAISAPPPAASEARLEEGVSEPRDVASAAAAAADAGKRRRGSKWGVIGFIGFIAGAGFLFYEHASAFEATDDAQIDSHIAQVSTRLSGTVKAVYVAAHQEVQAGELLAELDPKDFELALAAATAALERAEALLSSERPTVAMLESGDDAALIAASSELESARAARSGAERDVKQLEAQLAQAEAQATLAASEQARAVVLAAEGALSTADADARARARDAAKAHVDAVRQQMAATSSKLAQRAADIARTRARQQELVDNAPRRLESKRASLAAAEASWKLAKAQLEQAQTQLSYTKIYAPRAGLIGPHVIGVGESVAAGQLLLAICQTQDLWVTANFRETQLQNIRAGQPADIYADALDRTFKGEVESIGGATGSRFSLLPPENASGNYVKVVQRIPVKIRLEPNQPELARLRAGMSVEPSVKTR
ncbi:MAG TPA: HlyD family secretion protein [Polyangiales bacterium]|nr:HlyD family secretion protein [Polyangiales bacterium]